MTAVAPNNANKSPEGSLGSEALFMGIIDTVGYDVIVGAMRRRQEVIRGTKEGKRASMLDFGDVQLTVFADRIEFVKGTEEQSDIWRGVLGYDDARHVLNDHISEQLQRGPEPGE
jgi:hypothetical protein